MVMNPTRMIGVDTNGYPTQPDADNIIRSVDNELIQAMDLSVPLLTLFGGLDGFTVNAVKHAWVEDDLWRRRITTWSALTSSATNLTITAQAHRYPVGTIFSLEDELMRLTAHVDVDNVTVVRGYAGTSAAAHSDTTKVITIAGSSMNESDNWVYRPTPVVTLPYNYSQMDHTALRQSWRRKDVNLYGINGSEEMSKNVADTLAQKTVMVEGALVRGQRYVGGGPQTPATSGGLEYFVTSANGAYVLNKSGASLTLADIYTAIDSRVSLVGVENVPRTIIVDRWGKEKISSFFAGSRRMTSDDRVGQSIIDTLRTEWGDFKIVMHYALPPGNLYMVNDQYVKVGHLGQVGLLHMGEVPQNDGPFTGMYVYMDFTFRIKNIPTAIRIHNYSITS